MAGDNGTPSWRAWRARASAADQRLPESRLTLRMQAARQFYTL